VIETKEMRDRLASYMGQDNQHSLTAMLRRLLEDAIRPRTDKGGFRVSPILLLLAVLSVFSSVTFLYFSMVHP
jgi:hypothetical protein